MDDTLASAIAATQEQLGGLFQKPKLSEKLLSKAPFRFLHDIVSAVTASTGFAAGLYSGEELDSGAIKDKAAKMAYLEKLAALVGICMGHEINVRPSKVVAGLEPEGTNALLTALGKCARSTQLDFDEAVRRALSGESPGSNAPPPHRGDGAVTSNNSNDNGDGRAGGSTGGEERSTGNGEAKAEEKRGGGGDGGGGRRGSAGSSGGGGGGGGGGSGSRRGSSERGEGNDEKASAKQEMEAMGAAAKALGVPQSRRLSSRAGGPRAEAKSDNLATGGLGEDPSGTGGRDLTGAIEACTGDISVTRGMLETIIGRPKLSDKLLNMPPFRFLHDIVSEVTRQTGFGKGLYLGEELDSSLVKAKPAKMAYLDKLITLVGKSLNTLVDARPAKIVAGLEAENTNRMLQLLALAAVERPDSSRAVAAVLGSNAAPPRRRSSSGSTAGVDKGEIGRNVPGERDQQPSSQKQEEKQHQQKQDHHRQSSSVSDASASGANGSANTSAPAEDGRGGSRESPAGERKTGSRQESAEDKSSSGGTAINASGADAEATQPGKSDHDEPAGGGGGEGARSMRPRTARRRPPAVRDNTKDFAEKNRAQVPDESKAPPKVASIIMDGEEDKESDDEEINDTDRATRAFPSTGLVGGGGGSSKGEGGHTAMVADILKEKERAEFRAKEADAEAKGGGAGQGGQDRKGASDGGGGGIRMGRLRGADRSTVAAKAGVPRSLGGSGGGYGDADVAKLKDAIQTLCQSTHPLGKCMDFAHEDLALMSQEMERWRALHKVKAEALESERSATVEFLQPLRLQLRDLEDQLKESTMKINGVKASISVNEKKINSLLKMVVTS